MKRILIAPNAFKGALDAESAAEAIEAGLIESKLECTCVRLPIADGGDGSLPIIAKYLDAEINTMKVRGPLGSPVMARFGFVQNEGIAIIELAEASGIRLFREKDLDPWRATTFGTGQLMKKAVEEGAKSIYLTIGGSATVDGALGILDALGARFHDDNGIIENPTPKNLEQITNIQWDHENLKGAKVIILCDVNNPFLGIHGAATVFAPQKGAAQEDIPRFEKGFESIVKVIEKDFGRGVGSIPHGGAAGGVAAVLHGVLGAELKSGAEQILDWADFDVHLKAADLVITGEGKIDEQTQFDKGPGLVAKRAKSFGKKVIGFSGFVEGDGKQFPDFDQVIPLSDGSTSLKEAMSKTSINLTKAALKLGAILVNQ